MVKNNILKMKNNILKMKHKLDEKLQNKKQISPRPESVSFAMHMITRYCDSRPTCKGCDFVENHWGCYFRGKSPREW